MLLNRFVWTSKKNGIAEEIAFCWLKFFYERNKLIFSSGLKLEFKIKRININKLKIKELCLILNL